MGVVIIFGVGVLIGCIHTAVIFSVKSLGSLRIETSDPNDNPSA